MVIHVLDHVTRCYSNADGEILFNLIKSQLDSGQNVVISFSGVDSVSTSFVNSAFVDLLDHVSFEFIKSKIKFVNSNSQINDVIKRRFSFEVNERKKVLNV